jgi:ADP-heptose:LPS heptosyltransferase
VRILICRQDKLGDFIMTTAIFTAVREAFPDAELGVLVSPAHAELAAMHPARMAVQVGPGRINHREAIQWGWRWRREKWDAILMIPENARCWSYAAWLSGCPIRLGLCNRFFRSVFNHLELNRWSGRRHEVQLTLHLGSEALGRRLNEHPLWLPSRDVDQAEADLLLQGRRGFIAVGLGTGGTAPLWPMDRWRQLLIEIRKEAEIVILGPAAQAELVREAAEGIDVIDLTGRTSLLNLGAVLARARLVVCGNTGLLHAAAAAQAPVMVLETSNHDRYFAMRWGPWKSPGWHVFRRADGSVAEVEDALAVFRWAWPMTLDQEALRMHSR